MTVIKKEEIREVRYFSIQPKKVQIFTTIIVIIIIFYLRFFAISKVKYILKRFRAALFY